MPARAWLRAGPRPGSRRRATGRLFRRTTLLPIDGPIDSFTVTPDNIIKVDKSDASPNQLSIVGLAGGSATLTVKSGDRTLLYDVAVSPAPERLYINSTNRSG